MDRIRIRPGAGSASVDSRTRPAYYGYEEEQQEYESSFPFPTLYNAKPNTGCMSHYENVNFEITIAEEQTNQA